MSEIVQKNCELLYLYDARLCNPNGDPDEENKPRMDYETGRNLVSDVRLKRYLRDYWLALSEEQWRSLGYTPRPDVWVRQLEDSSGKAERVSAKQRIEGLAREFGAKSAKEAFEKPEFPRWLMKKLIDARFFGATIPIGKAEGETAGGSHTFVGPVQFSWGYSLNRVEILPSATISSQFSGREEEEGQYGTFGKDWRVKYSLLAFYGTISAWRAKRTFLTEQDVRLLDYSLLEALPLLATTRSKLGQTPRLFLHVQYKDDQTFLGDLRAGLTLKREGGLESIKDVELNFTELLEQLQRVKDKIEKIVFWTHPDFVSGKHLAAALEAQFRIEAVQDPGSL